MQTGRNEACACGSGKKFKNCCIGEAKRRSSRGLMILFGVIALVAAAGVVPQLLDKDEPRRTQAPAASSRSTSGKVWSSEHNHWHDAGTPATSTPVAARPPARPPITPATAPTPQPPGPAPAGQVWSAEHGHWHDAPK